MPDKDAPAQPAVEQKKSGRTMQIAIVALLMIGEGAGIFFLTKALSPAPAAALADEGGDGSTGSGALANNLLVEVELAECRPTNRMLGKLITYNIRVTVLVAAEDQEQVEALIEANESRVRDRVNYVLRSADPAHLDEPGLQTIKRRLKHECDKLFGDDRLIKAVLIPQLLQSRGSV